MPRAHRPKPVYQRGSFALHEGRPGRNLEIVWYDRERKRERSTSAGTRSVEEGKIALDRLFLAGSGGSSNCPTCGQAIDRGNALIASIIADYLIAHGSAQSSSDAIASRLDHVLRYIGTLKDQAVRARHISERWITGFRKWLTEDPYRSGKSEKMRSPATVENSIVQLAAAMRWAREDVVFKPIPLKELSRTPEYRADIADLAAMFRYALESTRRSNLLAFLRLSVITWARPDAVMDASTAPLRGQWFSKARVMVLNPKGRRQTRKYRATVPVPESMVWWIDEAKGPIVKGGLSKATWQRMEVSLGMPRAGQSGMKLIRRSVATIARRQLGEEHWIQGRMMLGHVQPTTSDIYAVADPSHLGRAMAATSAIIEAIEQQAPGAFYRTFTADAGNVVSMQSRKKG